MIGTSKLSWDWYKSKAESFLQLVSSLKTTERSLGELRLGKTIGYGRIMGMGKHDFFSGYQFLSAWYQNKSRPPWIRAFKSSHLHCHSLFDTLLTAVTPSHPSLEIHQNNYHAINIYLKSGNSKYSQSRSDGHEAIDYPGMWWYLSLPWYLRKPLNELQTF